MAGTHSLIRSVMRIFTCSQPRDGRDLSWYEVYQSFAQSQHLGHEEFAQHLLHANATFSADEASNANRLNRGLRGEPSNDNGPKGEEKKINAHPIRSVHLDYRPQISAALLGGGAAAGEGASQPRKKSASKSAKSSSSGGGSCCLLTAASRYELIFTTLAPAPEQVAAETAAADEAVGFKSLAGCAPTAAATAATGAVVSNAAAEWWLRGANLFDAARVAVVEKTEITTAQRQSGWHSQSGTARDNLHTRNFCRCC